MTDAFVPLLVKLPLLQVPKLKESVPVPTMASGDEKSAKARTCDEARLLTEISCENAEASCTLENEAVTEVPLLFREIPLMPL